MPLPLNKRRFLPYFFKLFCLALLSLVTAVCFSEEKSLKSGVNPDVSANAIVLAKSAASYQGDLIQELQQQDFQPEINDEAAHSLIQQALDQQGLFWQQIKMPYSVASYAQDKEAELLQLLYKKRIIDRKSEMKMVTIAADKYRPQRQRITSVQTYLNLSGQERTGIPYGRARVKELVSLSQPYLVGDYYYAEAYVRWYVEDVPNWVRQQAAQNFRFFRRVLESPYKPFEKRFFLQFDQEDWVLWQSKPKYL